MECSSSDEEKHLEMSENSENIYVNLDTNENNTDTAVPIAVENPSYNTQRCFFISIFQISIFKDNVYINRVFAKKKTFFKMFN